MADNLKLTLTLNADGTLAGTVNQAKDAVDSLGQAAKNTGDTSEKAFGKTKAGLQSISEQLAATKQQFLGFIGLKMGSDSIGSIIKTADAYTAMQGQIKLLTDSTAGLVHIQEKLAQVSLSSYADLPATVKLFSSLDSAMLSLGKTTDQSIAFTQTFNRALSLTSPTTEQSQAAVLQFSQAMGSGVLRGDEFNSMMENGRGVVQALADGLKVPIGALRSMAEQGQLTAEVVIKALEKQSNAIDEKFVKKSVTVGQAMQNMQTNALLLVGAIDQTTGASNTLANGILGVSKNLENIATVAGVAVTGALVAQAIPAIVSTSVALSTMAAAGALATTSITAASVAAARFALTPWGMAITAGAAAIGYLALESNRTATAVDSLREAAQKSVGTGGVIDEVKLKASAQALRELTAQLNQMQSEKELYISTDVFNQKVAEVKAKIAAINANPLAINLVTEMDIEGADRQTKQIYDHAAQWMAEQNAIVMKVDVNFSDAIGKMQEQYALIGLSARDAAIAQAQFSLQSAAKKDGGTATVEQLDAIKAQAAAIYDATKAIKDQQEASNQAAKAIKDAQELAKKAAEEQSRLKRKANDDDYADFERYLQQEVDANFKAKKEMLSASEKLQADIKATLSTPLQTVQASKTNDRVVDSMSSLTDTTGNMFAYYEKEKQSLKDIADLKQKTAADETISAEKKTKLLEDLSKKEAAITENSGRNGIAMYANLAGAASTMFAQNSKEQKALHEIQKTLTVATLAMDAQKMLSAQAVMATDAAGMAPKAGSAILSALSAPFPMNFVAGAAMAAIVGSVMSAFGGSGGGSVTLPATPSMNGASSPIGSKDPSESLAKSLAYMNDNGASQYKELTKIYAELKSMNTNLTSFATSLFVAGDMSNLNKATAQSKTAMSDFVSGSVFNPLKDLPVIGQLADMGLGLIGATLDGIFGSTKKSFGGSGLTMGNFALGGQASISGYQDTTVAHDGGWFGDTTFSTDRSYVAISADAKNMLQRVFNNLHDGVINIGTELNRNVTDQVNNFVVSIGDISTYGKSGDEITKALNNAVSGQADKLAYSVFGDIVTAYGKMNEGYFQTLNRLITDKAVVQKTLSDLGITLKGDVLGTSQAFVTLAGTLNTFVDKTATYFDLFYTTAEKFTLLSKNLTDAMSSVGINALPKTAAEYKTMVSSQDLSTAAGQQTYYMLVSHASDFKSYFDQNGGLTNLSQTTMAKFSDGGFTGNGGVLEPAGIVHKGEYVVPAWMLRKQPDLAPQLESIRSNGFASGGMVGGSISPSNDSKLYDLIKRMVDIIRKWDGDGMPAVRV